MAQGDINITVVGNVVTDPELRYTNSGTPVASFRVASNTRRFDQATGQWVNGDSTFLTCNAWRNLGQNIVNSITKGTRVVVTGVFRENSYTDAQGNPRTSYEIQVEDIGPSLRYATAEVTRLSGGAGQSGGYSAGNAGGNQGGYQPQAAPQSDSGFPGPSQDPWQTAGDSGFPQGNSQAQPPF
ncbi:MAG: single-stranded DNA-binding protein [Corynebacterium sp.]|nr:single-stranded DNA-binding protein [Corynebacterium sp.]